MATVQLTPVGVGIRHVLIATDFSPCSSAALDFGLRVAKDSKANASVVFVLPSDQFLLSGPEVYGAARDAARRDLQELQAELNRTHAYVEGEDYHCFLLEGDVVEAVLDFARKNGIDLIVVGTHGRSGLPKALLGSVAERIFRHAPVPVLTLGPGLRHRALHAAPKQILVAADFTPASRRAVGYASRLAREHNSHLTLLHVLAPKQLEHVPDRAVVEHSIQVRLKELLGGGAEGVQCSVRTEVGSVTPTVLECANEIAADLLVLGVRASSGVLDRLVIPHAYEIVRDAPCPVLTLREEPVDADL